MISLSLLKKAIQVKNKNDHGIGLTIINEIVDEYHGINQYQQTDQYLVNDIILFDVIR